MSDRTPTSVRSLLNKFEPPPPKPAPPPKERVKSAIATPRAILSTQADQALAASRARSNAPEVLPLHLRTPPSPQAGDSDVILALKRAIVARHSELCSAVTHLQTVAERLAVAQDAFSGSVVVDAPVATADDARVASGLGATGAKEADVNKVVAQRKVERKSASSSPATSLEAILAAARGGGGGGESSTGTGSKAKYARMLRDLK